MKTVEKSEREKKTMRTETGYIYYVNKQTGERQNDDPKLLEIINVIREHHKSIKFLAYRVATKIWFLKQSFYSEFSILDSRTRIIIISDFLYSGEHSIFVCFIGFEPLWFHTMR